MTLGMIWTIILRFAIQDISVEGKGLQVACPSLRHGAGLMAPLCRDLGQGGAAAVVPEEDGALQERQRAELPHQVGAARRGEGLRAARSGTNAAFCLAAGRTDSPSTP